VCSNVCESLLWTQSSWEACSILQPNFTGHALSPFSQLANSEVRLAGRAKGTTHTYYHTTVSGPVDALGILYIDIQIIQVADISNESLPCRTGSDATFFSHGFGSFGSKVRGLFRSMVPKLYNLYII